MKYRIQFSVSDGLFQVQTKRILSKWENKKTYFYTAENGEVMNVKGFPTYGEAESWMHDRYPALNLTQKSDKNENIVFGF